MDKDLQSVQEARDLIERAHAAFLTYRGFAQAQVDGIVGAMAAAATANAERLARLAVEETTYGKVADKIQKNLFASQRVYEAIRALPTIGVIRDDPAAGITEIAEPVGVVAAVLPCTNPTSTAIYKILIALKAGNAIVVSPHPAAMRCICETVGLMWQAAKSAGAPEGLIGCFALPSMAGTQELMRHRRTGVILATGGMSIVRAAYSSGKPAFGVGPGNVPAFVDRSAQLAKAVADVVAGKTFDWGTICSSEQALVAEEALRAPVTEELRKNGAYFLNAEETEKLGNTLILRESFTVNPKCVGQSPQRLGELAGFAVPAEARVLVAELKGMGKQVPLSAEKLSPVLALYFTADRAAAFELCSNLLHFGGLGHTCVIHAQDRDVIREYGLRMPAFRVVVNSPAPQGSIGATTNLFPAMTLGCGAAGGNITSDNIGPQHLINIKRIARETRPPAAAAAVASPDGAGAACACQHAPAPPPAVAAREPAFTPPAAGGLDRAAIRQVIERFLAEKLAGGAAGIPAPALAPAAMPAATPPPAPTAEPQSPPSPPARPAAAPPAPPAEFVCESDVREALRERRRIRIGPKTLLTPSARDLGFEKGIFEEV
ncbi:MAG TPA: aldehyde dehydrogenase family protein [Terriglobales bacterium]|nr:aldehyde dehydrogenase family protein [Terriglobales bacterium]